MTTDIVKAQTNSVIRSMDDAERAAKAMAASGFFSDSKSASQAVVKILAGQELGFGPFASMTGVNIIQNKPVLSANLMAAAVKRTGKYNYRVTLQTDAACEIAWYEGGQEVGRSKYTIEEARRAGLENKDNWKKYPSDMLFARAISRGQKRYAPDIFNGATVYTPDELGAVVDEEGFVVSEPTDATPVATEAVTVITPEQPAQSLQGVRTGKTTPRPAEDGTDDKQYRYNDAKIVAVIAEAWGCETSVAATTLYAMFKSGELPDTLTIDEAVLVRRPEQAPLISE